MARRGELIPAQRRALVLEHIRSRGAASIQELAEAIAVSNSTIRRDLEELELAGYLERTRGGALLERTQKSTFEPEAALAAEIARPQKQAIGGVAANMIRKGESAIFDSSSTVMELARIVATRDLALTAVTNDLGIGSILARNAMINVVVPGGTIRPGSQTLRGEPGQKFLETIHTDITFIGTHAISGGYLSETSLEIAALKRLMIAAARRVVLLADSSKFQTVAFCRICAISEVHQIVTDDGLRSDDAQSLRDFGIDVIIAPVLHGERDKN